MIVTAELDRLDMQQLREMVHSSTIGAPADKLELAPLTHGIAFKQAAIAQLTQEMAVFKRNEPPVPKLSMWSRRTCWKRPSMLTWQRWSVS